MRIALGGSFHLNLESNKFLLCFHWCLREEFGQVLTSGLILILWVQLGKMKSLILPRLLKIDQSMKTLGLQPLLALNNTSGVACIAETHDPDV